MLILDLCDYSAAYIIVKETTSINETNNASRRNKNLTFKNSPLFRICISKINNTFIDNAEDFEVAMSMYNLLEYISTITLRHKTFVELLQR